MPGQDHQTRRLRFSVFEIDFGAGELRKHGMKIRIQEQPFQLLVTLIDHAGKLIEDAGWFWDHAEERYKIAHDYIFVNYVCTNGKHYPLDFRRFQKKDRCQSLKIPLSASALMGEWVVHSSAPTQEQPATQ